MRISGIRPEKLTTSEAQGDRSGANWVRTCIYIGGSLLVIILIIVLLIVLL